MRKSARVASWAVYQATVQGQPGPKVVCLQGEWEAIELATPGLHRLIRGGITNEGEAERLARGTAGDDPVRTPRKGPIEGLLDPAPDVIVESGGEVGEEGPGPVLLPFPARGEEAGDLDAADTPPARIGVGPGGEVA